MSVKSKRRTKSTLIYLVNMMRRRGMSYKRIFDRTGIPYIRIIQICESGSWLVESKDNA